MTNNCRNCKINLTVGDNWFPSYANRVYPNCICKTCSKPARKARSIKYYEKNRDMLVAYSKNHYHENREAILAGMRAKRNPKPVEIDTTKDITLTLAQWIASKQTNV